MKYTYETLEKINTRYCCDHLITDSDISMANRYVEIIEKSRLKSIPVAGDIIQYTDEYGDHYCSAHVEYIKDGEVNICERPYIPFISITSNGVICSTSGGSWHNLPIKKLIYAGEREKRFCNWGCCGPCANGAVVFDAKVNVWSYTSDKNPYISKNTGNVYTTKDFDKMYVYYKSNKKNSDYIFFGDGIAWKSDITFQAWLRTYRAEVFHISDNKICIWYWKEKTLSVSPEEFEMLDLPEDTLMNNGRILRCKRSYDEQTHTIYTYWVWYWDEPNKDWRQSAMEQNKIREQYYELDRKTPVNQFAIDEIKNKKIIPISLENLKKGKSKNDRIRKESK